MKFFGLARDSWGGVAVMLFVAAIGATSFAGIAACDDANTQNDTGETGETGDTGDTGETGETASDAACTVLYGRPNEKTGLTDEQCQPVCNCNGRAFEDIVYSAEDIAALKARVLVNPPEELGEDPYAEPTKLPSQEGVCGVRRDASVEGGYRLDTYESVEEAQEAGAQVTHFTPCGACSSLADLAVYIETPDLTEPVRSCGTKGLGGNSDAVYGCIRELGFTPACARIWAYNTQFTGKECLDKCLPSLINKEPYHKKDGSLNDCLQCDEDKAGPVFKAYAGRTRRNTGVANPMCRPCDDVQPLVHRYE